MFCAFIPRFLLSPFCSEKLLPILESQNALSRARVFLNTLPVQTLALLSTQAGLDSVDKSGSSLAYFIVSYVPTGRTTNFFL